MGVFKTKGSHTRVKSGEHAGASGTIVGKTMTGKRKVKLEDGSKANIKKKKLGRNLGK